MMDPRCDRPSCMPELEGRRRPAAASRSPADEVPVPFGDRREADTPALAHPRLHAQRRQLRHQPGQRGAAGWHGSGRGAGRGDLPRLSPRPRCSTTTRAPCAAWPPATWAWASDGDADTTASSWAWSCTRKYTIFAEGARGQPGQASSSLKLRPRWRAATPQSYGHRHQGAVGGPGRQGAVRATWCTPPAGRWTWTTPIGGSLPVPRHENNKVELGYVIGLDYKNPWT